MSRALDAAFPAVTPDPDGPPSWMTGRLVVALERLPQSAYVWDDDDPDVTWDDTTPERVWDAPFVGSGYTDVWCDLVRLELATGEPDTDDAYRTPYARLELRDPGDGRYRTRTVDGRLVYYAPGRRLAVWWEDPTGGRWWLFSGAVATWRDPLNDPVVTVEAYGCPGRLAEGIGREWTAGTAGQFPQTRLSAILTAVGATGIRTRFDVGDVQLTVPAAADVGPLDVLRRTARSDGGIIYADTDDTLLYRDRRWRTGRTDQTSIPIWTGNVCDGAAMVLWDVTSADVDLLLAGRVNLANDAGLVATATGASYVDSTIVYRHPDPDLWTTQAEGNALAAHIAAERSTARMALAAARVYLHDPRNDYWLATLDRRLGDRVRFVQTETWTDPDRTEFYDLTLVLTTIRHEITPDTWTVDFSTSPAVAYTAVELWDWTLLTWDDPSPLAVWR